MTQIQQWRATARGRVTMSGWAVSAAILSCLPTAMGDWPTFRGTMERTGNVDDKPASNAPKILWVYKAREHYVASPVPEGRKLYLATLGAFNTGVFHCLTTKPDAAARIMWSKTTPFIKRPTVCAPAVAGGLVVLGDGMHQTDDAILYCLRADTGRPVWQFPVPGKLVHMECSPTIDKGRVYIGAGDAGVLCLALDRVTLDGIDQNFAAAQALIDKRWAELAAKYEQDREKDPDFAVPPGDEALPKPVPKLFWQSGRGKWHVDAPVAVTSNRVWVASAFLDDEKLGDRSLLSLNTGDGNVVWKAPLQINPWAGPSVAGDLVLAGCSSIRFDVQQIGKARGEVVAVDVQSGQIRWRKGVTGGVLSSVAVKDGLAVFTATDGRVRALEVSTGAEKWTYEGGNPFFAGPAVAGGMVYVADLKGILHALGLTDGKPQWTLDIAADPAVQMPGMVYGSPVLHEGRIYLATCNLEGTTAGQPCAVVCVSEKSERAQETPAPPIAIDRKNKTISIPCKIAARKLPALNDIYPLEVIATFPSPLGQKAHETVVTFLNKPSEIHSAFESLGLTPGKPVVGEEGGPPAGPEMDIMLEIAGVAREPRRVPIAKAVVDSRTGKPLSELKWYFTGSVWRQPDPDKKQKVYGADLSGTLITIFPVTDETVFQSSLSMKDRKLLRLETNKDILPPEGTEVKLIIAPRKGDAPAAARAAMPRPASEAFEPLRLSPAGAGLSESAELAATPVGLSVPSAAVKQGPQPLPWEKQCPVRQRPVADIPPLVSDRTLPAWPFLPVGPLPHAESAESAPSAAIGLLPSQARPSFKIEDDPTVDISRDRTLSRVPSLDRSPAPLLRLAIPDPFQGINAVQLPHPLPETNTPAGLPVLPSRPTLSPTNQVQPAAK